MEASLARKRNNVPASTGLTNESTDAGTAQSNGAMDSLLEKLRAAAPQARDQRDRRRRARLKERHQVRVASGQKMPDPPINDGESATNGAPADSSEPAEADAPPATPQDSQENEDITDRATSILQGLRSTPPRRRDSNEDSRRMRRLRRRNAPSSMSRDESESTLKPVPESSDDHGNAVADPVSSPTESSNNKRHDSSPISPTGSAPEIIVSKTRDEDEEKS